MTVLKQELKLIKGGKYSHKTYSKKSQYYFKKREAKRKQKLINYANACIDVLQLMQKVARAINPAFYFERLVPHYEVLRSSISNSQEAETYSTNIIERELCIYKHFAQTNPQRLEDYNKVLAKGEDEFSALLKEREEAHTDKETGLRFIAKKLMLYVTTKEAEFFLEINEELVQYQDKTLVQLFYNITIHINFLNTTNNGK